MDLWIICFPWYFKSKQAVTVENGQIMDLDEWKERLTALDMERTAQVDGMGQFSIRGGIVDIFPLTEEVPVRIELWDDEVDSIRSFDPESQRSVEQLEKLPIYPVCGDGFDEKQLEAGIAGLEKEEKEYEAPLGAKHQIEEASRIRGIIKEPTEGIKTRLETRWIRRIYQVFLPGNSVISGLLSCRRYTDLPG